MGTGRCRKRKHVYLSVACLILLMFPACAVNKQMPKEPVVQPCAATEAQQPAVLPPREFVHLERVRNHIARGDFDGAVKQCQEVLTGSPNTPPGDEALMDLGLISAHYANPKKDYKKAMNYFMRVEKEFPASPLVEESKIWVSVLRAFEKAKQVDLEIEHKKQGLGK